MSEHYPSHSHSFVCEMEVQPQEEPKTMYNIGVTVPPSLSRPSPNNAADQSKIEKWYMTLFWLRIAALVLCMLAFSILAADNQKVIYQTPVYNYGFTQFSAQIPLNLYGRQIFRYSLSVYVIGFVYSAAQICDLVKYFITKNHTLDPKLRCYYNVGMDQLLTYLLVSASSSAAAKASDLKASYGANKFVGMANASIALSFFAFLAFASASLVSGFILTSFN